MKKFYFKPLKSFWVKISVIACLLGVLTTACAEPSTSSQSNSQTSSELVVNKQPESLPSSVPVSAIDLPTNTNPSPTEPRMGGSNSMLVAKLETPELCEIIQARVLDPEPPLNVRSEPSVQTGKIVGTLDNGSFLSVKGERSGWLQITYQGREGEISGWVAKNRTETNCNYKKQEVKFPQGGGSVQISDRFIGTGSHEYFFSASEGQTLTVTAKSGPLPFIFPPGDPNRQQDLSGGGGYSQKTNVTIELPATGDYVLEFPSNFRGYEYDILVELK